MLVGFKVKDVTWLVSISALCLVPRRTQGAVIELRVSCLRPRIKNPVLFHSTAPAHRHWASPSPAVFLRSTCHCMTLNSGSTSLFIVSLSP